MKALGKGSVSMEGLVLLVFALFDGVKYQNHIAIHDGAFIIKKANWRITVSSREYAVENIRKE